VTYRWLTDLDQALFAAHIDYTPVMAHPADYTGAPSWQTRGRPYSTGDFDPSGVLCHHTASPAGTSGAADLNAILWGNSQAPGPVSQLLVDRDAVVWLIAAGRANHGGSGIRPGLDTSCADMNAATIGIEASNDGVGEVWPAAQIDVYAAVVAALCDFYGWGMDRVWLHATTGPPAGGCNSKIDPAGPWPGEPACAGTWSLDVWRDFCSVGLPGPDPGPPPAVSTESEAAMAGSFVVSWDAGLPDGSVWELIHGARRNVGADEWGEVLKGVMADRTGAVPAHDPWTPVAYLANGWALATLPEYSGP